MFGNDIVFDRTNRTRARQVTSLHTCSHLWMYFLFHLRYFSPILTSPSKDPIFFRSFFRWLTVWVSRWATIPQGLFYDLVNVCRKGFPQRGDEFRNFIERLELQSEEEPNLEDALCTWASLRMQTLWRTVDGICGAYANALETRLFRRAGRRPAHFLGEKWTMDISMMI